MTEARLRDALEGSPLAQQLSTVAAPFLEHRARDRALAALAEPRLRGLARVISSSADAARFLSHRPELLEVLEATDAAGLSRRGEALLAETASAPSALERNLDDLRLLRRDETVLAACLDLGGAASFSEISRFLSLLAESIARRALRLARLPGDPSIALIGMGKIAGRELSYHSDLDLVFLVADPSVDAVSRAARTAQRLIAYLTTLTGAGIAYAVDSRLRPSGRQGALVSTFDAWIRYQTCNARAWEHLALMRARPIAGDIDSARITLDSVRSQVLQSHENSWTEVARVCERVLSERVSGPERVDLKTGAGGTMQVDFLAAGGLLQRGRFPRELASLAAMLRCAIGSTPDRLLADWDLLRRVEARARWIAGRSVDCFAAAGKPTALIADLVFPGQGPSALLEAVVAARQRNCHAWQAVLEAGDIDALRGCEGHEEGGA